MKIETIFLQMFSDFVRGREGKEQEYVFKVEDWQYLISMSSYHQIVPMIYEISSSMEAFSSCPFELSALWKRDTIRNVASQMQRTEEFLRLYGLIKEKGIIPLVVKGIVCRNLYPKPDYRMSGDEDMLIRREDFWKLDEILLEYDFFRAETDEDLKERYDTLHEVGYRNRKTGLYLEIHLSLFPGESGAYGHFNDLFTGLHEKASVVVIEGQEIYTLNETEHFLYLLCHSLKHFLHSGFGVRQVVDMILFAEHYGKHICWEEIIKKTKENNMYVFLWNLLDIGIRYFEFDMKKAEWPVELTGDSDSEDLLYDLLMGGVYGASSEDRIHSSNITLAAADKEDNKNGLIASLFPGRSYMEKRYLYVKKHPWMLPIAWMERIVKHVGKSKGKDKTQMMESMSIGNQRVKLLKKYGVIE